MSRRRPPRIERCAQQQLFEQHSGRLQATAWPLALVLLSKSELSCSDLSQKLAKREKLFGCSRTQNQLASATGTHVAADSGWRRVGDNAKEVSKSTVWTPGGALAACAATKRRGRGGLGPPAPALCRPALRVALRHGAPLVISATPWVKIRRAPEDGLAVVRPRVARWRIGVTSRQAALACG